MRVKIEYEDGFVMYIDAINVGIREFEAKIYEAHTNDLYIIEFDGFHEAVNNLKFYNCRSKSSEEHEEFMNIINNVEE